MMKWDSMKSIMQHRPTFEKEEAEATYKYMLEDTFITDAEAVKNGFVSFSVLDYSLNSENFINDVTELIDV